MRNKPKLKSINSDLNYLLSVDKILKEQQILHENEKIAKKIKKSLKSKILKLK